MKKKTNVEELFPLISNNPYVNTELHKEGDAEKKRKTDTKTKQIKR